MGLYISKPTKPSKSNFKEWQQVGFRGDYEHYLEVKKRSGNSPFFIHGDLGEHCSDCADVGDLLCDYPVGDGKTCDRLMCEDHSHEIAPDVHYCEHHYGEWRKFVESGGIDAALKNVVAFSGEKK